MIKIFFASMIILFQTSIYTHTVTGINGNEIDFSDFQGKKILLVNIATNSPRASQLGELQQLHEQYGDSLVIVGFPSNSFGNEQKSNSGILHFCQTQYGVSFLLAAKGPVKGGDIQPFYYWLTNKTENGVFGNEIKSDFQKYLFDRNGNPLGVFAGSLSPLNYQLVNAITGVQN
jgi:glutathione peroxidase